MSTVKKGLMTLLGITLKKVKTTELGSLYEVVYSIQMGPGTNQKEFLDAIRTRNGNLDITLTMNPAVQEY